MIPGGVAVVIPARNEAEYLAGCLTAVGNARAALQKTLPQIAVTVTVVLDSCTDGSALVVAGFPEAQVVTVDFGVVGRTRDAGIRAAPASRGLWIANTDADTAVPENWLTEQCRLAALGYALVLGTVVPGPGLDDQRRGEWQSRNPLRDNHAQVHGANLGFARSIYLEAGGFAPLEVGEDVDLINRIKERGVPWTAVDSMRAVTSAREEGRAPSGFAHYLRNLLGS
ncbi:glycosyltransferase [Arthrobacter sp. H5]|uniref:glycosyltransferase n=1 Tax=Arthrobacter sp. H5 TaxID=1267973 RepID=UPI000482AF1A|nr:glycosyltransferase [Arthrobacter sp. H5]